MDGQQEQVDKVQDHINYSKAATQVGAERIHDAAIGICGQVDEAMEDEQAKERRLEACRNVRVEEEFNWKMPFETMHDDMRAVQKDVMQFGKDLIDDLKENVHNLDAPGPFSCSSSSIQSLGVNFACHEPMQGVTSGANM